MRNSAATSEEGKGNGGYHHGDLRRTLITAALELAAEGNDWDFSLRELARRAGVSHNAPYSHFARKKDLIAAAALAGHELLRNEIASAVAKTKDPRAGIYRVGSTYMRFGIQNPALYQLMFTASLSGPNWRPETVVAAGEETRAMVDDLLRNAMARGMFAPTLKRETNVRTATLFGWSAVHGFTMLVISGLTGMEEIPIERLTDKIMNMVLDVMLGKKP